MNNDASLSEKEVSTIAMENVKISTNQSSVNVNQNQKQNEALSIPSDDVDETFASLTILGMCGSIGTGKSYASSLLTSKLNDMPFNTAAYHIDTDSLAHQVYAPGSEAIDDIEKEFGTNVITIDGTVDRKLLGAKVFSDRNEMIKLEKIVWPHVKALLIERLEEIAESQTHSEKTTIVIVEAAVLLDANWDRNGLFDGIWVIRASSKTMVDRLVQHRGMDEKDAIDRIDAQLSRRGIGNWEDELNEGTITAVIGNEGPDLWDNMKESLLNPNCWKASRFPSFRLSK